MEKLRALVTAEVIRPTLEHACGHRVDFTYEGYTNDHEGQPFKITYPDDIEIGEILLKRLQNRASF